MLANIKPNWNDNSDGKNINDDELEETNKSKKSKKKSRIKTIKGISKLFYWEWPCQDEYNGYIYARPLPHIGNWSDFSPSYIAELWNVPLHKPQPSISQYTVPETQWNMPIITESNLTVRSNDSNIFTNGKEIDIGK